MKGHTSYCRIFNLVNYVIVLLLCSCANASVTPTPTSNEFFDLSYSVNNDTIFFPGQKEFHLSKDYEGISPGGFWYSSFSFCMGEHGGTHVDAPYHFFKDGWTVDKIPWTRLVDVPATLIDVEEKVNLLSNPDEFSLEVQHLLKHEEKFGIIPYGSVLLIHTGWSRFWPDKVKYLGWDNSTVGKTSLNFPGLSEEAAKFLTQERNIFGLGIDTASVDVGNTKKYPVHQILSANNVYTIENVANLHLITRHMKENSSEPSCNLRLFVLPLKIGGGTGAPVRLVARCQ